MGENILGLLLSLIHISAVVQDVVASEDAGCCYYYAGNYYCWNIIANINNFLEYVDKNKDVLVTERYYEAVKGEALRLRAFLHFDLLRMFGPVYKEHPASKAIPYRTTFDKDATPVLAANEVVDAIPVSYTHLIFILRTELLIKDIRLHK